MTGNVIDRREGRRLFGADPAGYDAARPGHPDRVYKVLVRRCGLGVGTRVLEIGPGTGQATGRLLALGADPVVALEPDSALAAHVQAALDGRLDIRRVALEDAELQPGSFDLGVAASSFHWVDERPGLAKVASALRPGGWWTMWWTLFGNDEAGDAFREAINPLLTGLAKSPGSGVQGRPRFALDVEARFAALRRAGFTRLGHEIVSWSASWDTAGIRTLYSTFSPVRRLDDARREEVLDGVAFIAESAFGGRVERPLCTSLFTARKPR
jgi:SAM-dependent methyltransferase